MLRLVAASSARRPTPLSSGPRKAAALLLIRHASASTCAHKCGLFFVNSGVKHRAALHMNALDAHLERAKPAECPTANSVNSVAPVHTNASTTRRVQCRPRPEQPLLSQYAWTGVSSAGAVGSQRGGAGARRSMAWIRGAVQLGHQYNHAWSTPNEAQASSSLLSHGHGSFIVRDSAAELVEPGEELLVVHCTIVVVLLVPPAAAHELQRHHVAQHPGEIVACTPATALTLVHASDTAAHADAAHGCRKRGAHSPRRERMRGTHLRAAR